MNGVDYTRRLSKEREYFQDSLKKNNEAHQKRLEDVEKTTANITKKQSENYIKDKTELEKSYQGNLANLSDKNRESMNLQTDRFNRDIVEERSKFAQESNAKSKDFDQRLNDIKHSYKRAFGSEKSNNEEIREVEKKRYAGNVKDLTLKQDSQLKKYQNQIAGAGADLKDAFKREKQQLVRKQEEDLAEVARANFDEKDNIKKRLSTELKNTKEVHESEQEQLRDYTSSKIQNQQKVHSARNEDLAREYSENYEKGAREQHLQTVKTNRQHQDVLDNVRRDAQEKARAMDNEARRRDNGSNEFAEVVNSHASFNGKEIYEHKLKNAKSAAEEMKRNFEDHSANESKDNYNTLRSERAEAAARVDKTSNKLKAEKMLTVANEREKNQNRIDHQERQNLAKTNDYEHKLMVERKNGDNRVKNLKENFHKSMTEIEEKLRGNIEDVTRTANADKKEFTKKESERTIQQLADMKQEFNRQLDQTVQSYEFRIANAEKNFDELTMNSNLKIASMSQQAEQELEYERKTGAERRNAEVRGLKSAIDEQEHKHRMEINGMMVNYQKQLAKIQAHNDLKLKLITNDYETKLKEAQASKSRELAEKDNVNRTELERLKGNYQDDKNTTVAAYEAKLQQLKDHHETQMQQLNEFKKLT